MTLQEQTISKIRNLPEPLAKRVDDFVDFLIMDEDSEIWQLWQQFFHNSPIDEEEIPDYLYRFEELESVLVEVN